MEKKESLYRTSRFTLHASRLADGALLAVALIWGSTFVMVKDAVTAYPVFSFLALRFVFAALTLLPVVLLRRNGRESAPQRARGIQEQGGSPTKTARDSGAGERETRRSPRWNLEATAVGDRLRARTSSWTQLRGSRVRWLAPVFIGLALFAGYAFQTFGLRLTTPAKAGFITGLSVVIVPTISALALRQRLSRNIWLGVGLATAGLALLTLQVDLSVNPGDVLVLGCALAFAVHILLTGHFAPHNDPLVLTLGQILVVAVLAGSAAMLLESAPVPSGRVLFAAAFTGVLATSFAFGIQTLAQRFTTPTHTALIFAAEPVFAALFSFLLIGEVLGLRQLTGCALILAGMVVAEVMRNEQPAMSDE